MFSLTVYTWLNQYSKSTYLAAATATAFVRKQFRVSFPPKAPPTKTAMNVSSVRRVLDWMQKVIVCLLWFLRLMQLIRIQGNISEGRARGRGPGHTNTFSEQCAFVLKTHQKIRFHTTVSQLFRRPHWNAQKRWYAMRKQHKRHLHMHMQCEWRQRFRNPPFSLSTLIRWGSTLNSVHGKCTRFRWKRWTFSFVLVWTVGENASESVDRAWIITSEA